MGTRTVCACALFLLIASVAVHGQRKASHPDLQGTWTGATLTPLQRPPEFKDRETFTPEEAAEYARTLESRVRSRFPTEADRLTQADLDDTYVETEVITLDRFRTSLVVDPPGGMLPPALPGVQARIAARPPHNGENPENFNLAERCLLGMFGLGGSLASPPMLPSVVAASYYQIVQNDDYVLIFAEWMHDARVIRMSGTHLAPQIKRWLGDSIGRWDGETLVVDTTNFRPETHNVDSGERLHVVERFTKLDAKTMNYRVTVEDPDTWASPWTAEWRFRATDSKIFEMSCHEGNYSLAYSLRGARAEEQREAPGR